LRVPAGLDADRRARGARSAELPFALELVLRGDLDRVDVTVSVRNEVRDHRLRVLLRAPFTATRFEVESAFEVAERPIAPGPDFFGPGPAEQPTGATPQRSFACVRDARRGLTVANRGSAEVEAVPESDGTTSLAVTVLRAVGWLSRDDLVSRPVHAGPPIETPGAQVPGAHRAELSVRLHDAEDPERDAEAHRFAVPARLFQGGGALGPLCDGSRMVEVDDPRVLISAIEPGGDLPPALRLYNASGSSRDTRVRWLAAEARGLEPVDLRGGHDPQVPCDAMPDGSQRLSLRPWQIVTLRVR